MQPRIRIGELSRRVGASVEVLRAWERRYGVLDPTRSDGGFRLYSSDDEARVRHMQVGIASGLAPAEAARAALAAHAPPTSESTGDPERFTEAFLDAVLEFDEQRAQGALEETLDSLGLENAIRRAIMPALREVGRRWELAQLTVAQEHFASSVIVSRLLRVPLTDSASGPLAVLACPAGEEHAIGLLCHALALRARDWRLVYLGADTPLAAVADAVARTGPRVVVLSAMTAAVFISQSVDLAQLGAHAPLLLAGPGANAAVAHECGATHLAGDPVEAAATLTRSPVWMQARDQDSGYERPALAMNG